MIVTEWVSGMASEPERIHSYDSPASSFRLMEWSEEKAPLPQQSSIQNQKSNYVPISDLAPG